MATSYTLRAEEVDVFNKKAFYEKAFDSRFYNIWAGTGITDYKLKSYIHACLIYLNANHATEHDRRLLLYNYMAGYFDVSDSTKLLNKIYALLPSSAGIIKKVLQNICTSYNNAPSRAFEIEETKSQELADLINNSTFNATMNTVERIAYLSGECIVRTYFDSDNTLQFDIVTRDNYTYIVNKQNERELWVHKTYYDSDNIKQDCFIVWTNESVKIVDRDLKVITDDVSSLSNFNENSVLGRGVYKHKYNGIPYLRIFLNDSNDDETNTQFDLIRSQLEDGRMECATMNNTVYNAFSMFMGINTNFKGNNFTFGAGNIIEYNNVDSEMASEPDLREIAPSTQYLELKSLRDGMKKDVLREYNLPNWAIDETANLQSGVAMELSRSPLVEMQKKNSYRLKQFDKKLVFEVCKMYNLYIADYYPEQFDIKIDYIETQYPADQKENYEANTTKFNAGIISAQTYLQSVTNIDDINSDEEAIEIINYNLGNLNKINKPAETIVQTSEENTDEVIIDEENANEVVNNE